MNVFIVAKKVFEMDKDLIKKKTYHQTYNIVYQFCKRYNVNYTASIMDMRIIIDMNIILKFTLMIFGNLVKI